ncbi:MAG: trehalose-phosphatase [Candidatus Limnocylindrales bacterium]
MLGSSRVPGSPELEMASAADALARVRPALAGRLLLASDFDGTISRLSGDLWRSAVLPAAQRALRSLAGSPATHVAFISGRTAADLAGRVAVGGATYHGDHGAEWAAAARGFRPSRLRVEHEPVDPAAQAMADRLKVEVPQLVAADWLVLEDKGSALTFHFRRAPDIDAARARVRAAVSAVDREGLFEQPGGVRMWELRPRGATNKRQTLERLMAVHRPDLVIMLGDDPNDTHAFGAIRVAREQNGLAGLAVGVLSQASIPEQLGPAADVVFAGAAVSARFLTLLARERRRR